MRIPKVLYVMTVRMAYEGMTMTALNFVRNIDRTKVHIDFAATDIDETLRREIESMGCTVHTLGERLKDPAGYMFRLMRLVRRGGYSAVHAHGNSCTLAIELTAAFLGGAKVRIAHSHNSSCKFIKAHRLLRPLFEVMYTHAFACGEEAGRWLFRSRKFRIMRNATESRKYAFDPDMRRRMRDRLGFDGETVIGSVANMNAQKNHGFMLDAFAALRKLRDDVKLVLVGEGPLRGDIEGRIKELGLEDDVTVLGTRTDVPQLLQAFDVMLLPSVYEGFPCVLVEWQCAGLRTFVSDTVTRDADLTGLLTYLPIDKGAEVWAEALKAVKPDNDRVMTGANAVMQVRGRGYDIVKTARETEKFYIEAVKCGR